MNEKIHRLTIAALFVALILLLGMTPLGLIPLGFINVTILCVPVVVGTLTMGPGMGLLLGACFGLVSTLRAFGIPLPASALVSNLMAVSPAAAVVMSMIPRLLVPMAAWLAYRFFEKRSARLSAYALAAIAGSLTNTIFYLGLMLLFYALLGLDSKAILGLIAGTGAIAGGSEAAVAALVTAPVVLAIRKIQKK